MSAILLVDFGSTYTKLTAVDTLIGDVIGTSSHVSTVRTDIAIGYEAALQSLQASFEKPVSFDQIIACSSAAGGLKMAAVGLVEELTAEAAKRACLGAGAKVDLVFSHHLSNQEIELIREKAIDILLLAGGTDGGNAECVLFNAEKLGAAGIKIPIIYAGNKSAMDDVKEIFTRHDCDGYFAENVMPKVNVLNVKSAREMIRDIFLKKIIEAKGIKKIESEIDRVMLPTPEAVLQAAELLSKGYLDEPGLGDLVLVDIGGATTDMYSLSFAAKRSDVILRGLEEPYAKRTVEGDLGMRYSALGIIKPFSREELMAFNQVNQLDLEAEASFRANHVEYIPDSVEAERVDLLLARLCTTRAMARHVGKIEEVFTPMGTFYHQTGKDLSDVTHCIGSGGVIIRSKDPRSILEHLSAKHQSPTDLAPRNPEYLLDQTYILSAMGLLSQQEPLLALKIMKKRLISV
ncbi:MAG: methylaspartate mutase accessory protein GlmL [Candidatus Izemoplasmatales bacterium]|nr:methylaspartate mutase accessory protein GlmL [Candidatus Izemoplasmatales bacterium]